MYKRINRVNSFNPISTKGGVNILNLLLGMSYNIPKMVGSKFQSPSIKIEDVCLREGVTEGGTEGQGAPIEHGPSGQLKTNIPALKNCERMIQTIIFSFKIHY